LIAATSAGAFQDAITFSVSGLPTGASPAILPVALVGAGRSIMTVATATSTPPGIYPLTITGTSSTLSHNLAATLTVTSAATPTFDQTPPGTYITPQTVPISTATPGASIIYTTDGSTPTLTNGTPYTSPVTVSATTTTINAIAYLTGPPVSAVASATYNIYPRAASPTYSPQLSGTYSSPQIVTISTTTSGASIRYTTDGSTPMSAIGAIPANGIVYTGPVTVSTTGRLRAIAFGSGLTDSFESDISYTINLQAATPSFTVAPGMYASIQQVRMSTTTSGASIRYTTDGSTPTSTTGTLYNGSPINISITTTINAIASEAGWADSSVASSTYTINPEAPIAFSPPIAADTYVTAGSGNNFGSSSTLNVGSGSTVLVQFNLGTLPMGLSSSSINRATLYLWSNKVMAAGAIDVAPATSMWNEFAVTSSAAPSVGAVIATVPVTQSGTWVTIDITSAFQQWAANPTSNYGLQISASSSAPGTIVSFDSKENTVTSKYARVDLSIAGFTLLTAPTVADATINAASPTSNFGATTALNSASGQSALVEFALSVLPTNSVSSDVNQATLIFWPNHVGPSGNIDVTQITSQWSESTVTYNTAPSVGAIQGTLSVTAASQWVTLDVTGLVKAWIADPSTNYGLQLSPSAGSAASVSFDSKESTNTKHPGQISIVLTSH
jgi:hypothetical protein